jgi:hypothetical protein
MFFEYKRDEDLDSRHTMETTHDLGYGEERSRSANMTIEPRSREAGPCKMKDQPHSEAALLPPKLDHSEPEELQAVASRSVSSTLDIEGGSGTEFVRHENEAFDTNGSVVLDVGPGPDALGFGVKEMYQETFDKRKNAQDMIAAAIAVFMAAMMGIVAILTQKDRKTYEDVPVVVIGIVVTGLFVCLFVWRYVKVIKYAGRLRGMRRMIWQGRITVDDLVANNRTKVNWTRKERITLVCFVCGALMISLTCLEIPLIR